MPPFADAPRVPVTERVSPHALDMESRGAAGVLEALAACDAEMWADAHADDGVGGGVNEVSFGNTTEEIEGFLLAMMTMKGEGRAPPKAKHYSDNLRSW